jgi:hypothetical protein
MAHKVHKFPRTLFTVGGTGGSGAGVGATADLQVEFKGELLTNILLEAYNSQNALTRAISFIDAQGVTAYSAAAIPDNANTFFAPTGGVPLDGMYTVRDKQSGAGATVGSDYLTLFLQP